MATKKMDLFELLRKQNKQKESHTITGNARFYFTALETLPDQQLIDLVQQLESQEDFYVVKGEFKPNGYGSNTSSRPTPIADILLHLDCKRLQEMWLPHLLQTTPQKGSFLRTCLETGRLDHAASLLDQFNTDDCKFTHRYIDMVAEAWISKTPSPENKSLYFDVYQSIIEKATLGGKLDARYRREVSKKLLDHCLEYDNPVAFDYYCTNKSMEDFLGISYYKETMEECLQKSIYNCKPAFLDYFAQKGYQLTTDLIEANTHSHLVYVSLTAYSADFDGWIEDQDNEWTPSERDWVLNWVKSIGQFPLLPQLFIDRLELFLEKTPNMANASVLKSILEQHSLDAATPAVTTRVRTPRL